MTSLICHRTLDTFQSWVDHEHTENKCFKVLRLQVVESWCISISKNCTQSCENFLFHMAACLI